VRGAVRMIERAPAKRRAFCFPQPLS
jgi:hypothetical protein